MTNVRLGKTEITVNKNGFGALPIQRIPKAEAVRLLHKAFDGGIRFYDTARMYTDSEEKLGAAFSGRREQIVISSKTGAVTPEGFWKDLETTLNNLKTDHLDLYQFHNPAFCFSFSYFRHLIPHDLSWQSVLHRYRPALCLYLAFIGKQHLFNGSFVNLSLFHLFLPHPVFPYDKYSPLFHADHAVWNRRLSPVSTHYILFFGLLCLLFCGYILIIKEIIIEIVIKIFIKVF